MDHFLYKGDEAFCEDLSLKNIANTVGTPAYIYSSKTLKEHCEGLKEAFASIPHTLCYAVKANSNLHILKKIFSANYGADIVSIGELERALLAGVDTRKMVYSSVGKQEADIARAIEVNILAFNVESYFELEQISRIATRMKKKAPLCLRVNPDIDAKTHPKISTGLHSSKFGIPKEQLPEFLNFINTNKDSLELKGLACHIGSQLLDLSPLSNALNDMLQLIDDVRSQGFALQYLNMGGGLGIRYTDEVAPSFQNYADVFLKVLEQRKDLHLILEPGRVLVGNAGILLSTVIGRKQTPQKDFLVIDATMNDLIRPTLYGSKHEFCLVRKNHSQKKIYDIVGPVCETSDFLGTDEALPELQTGDQLYVRSCGAYAMSMASNYNTRPRAVEVLVENSSFHIIRKRESLESLWKDEL